MAGYYFRAAVSLCVFGKAGGFEELDLGINILKIGFQIIYVSLIKKKCH